jgi:hypothetical protein
MINLLQTRAVNYKDLYSKCLISDLKEAATCEVKTVCRLPCDRCPSPVEYIDIKRVYIKGLDAYFIKLEKVENEQLLIVITSPNLDSWLLKNNLPFTTRKTIERRDGEKNSSKTKLSLVSSSSKLTDKVSL